jgi:zinc/manganese transport system substrate-binding protein
MNGLNDEFEPWLEPLLKQANFTGTKVVASRGAKTITGEEEHPISGTEAAPVIDQHAWMDPKNGVIYVRNIARALEQADPANAAYYKVHAAAYIKELQTLDAWMRTEITDVPVEKRRVISSHDLLEYLTKAYGITVISIYGWTNKSEPSAAEVSRLARCSSTASPTRDSCSSSQARPAPQLMRSRPRAARPTPTSGAAPRRCHAQGRYAEELM